MLKHCSPAKQRACNSKLTEINQHIAKRMEHLTNRSKDSKQWKSFIKRGKNNNNQKSFVNMWGLKGYNLCFQHQYKTVNVNESYVNETFKNAC